MKRSDFCRFWGYGAEDAVRRARFNRAEASTSTLGDKMPLTQAQLADAVAQQSGLSRADAKRALAALEGVILAQIGNAEKVKIGNLVQLSVRVKPATKARKGRNPANGEEITIAAKPASVDVRARVLAKAKAGAPSVQKARRRLAA
jgi:nucleoid DNA-binding protein